MTLSNQQRVDRCQNAITAYSDDDTYTNLVDLLADASIGATQRAVLPGCLDTALMHSMPIDRRRRNRRLQPPRTNERTEPTHRIRRTTD